MIRFRYFVWALKMQKVQVDLDALLIVHVLSSFVVDNFVVGLIINKCKLLLNKIHRCKTTRMNNIVGNSSKT